MTSHVLNQKCGLDNVKCPNSYCSGGRRYGKKASNTHTEGPSTARSPKTRRLCSVGCINFSHVNIIFIKVILSQLDAASRGETLRKR